MYRKIAADVSRQLRKQGFTPGAPYLEKLIDTYEDMRQKGSPRIGSLLSKMKKERLKFQIQRNIVIDAFVIYNELRLNQQENHSCLYHLCDGIYADRLPGTCIYDD